MLTLTLGFLLQATPFDTPVTVERKDQLLIVLARQIADQSHTRISVHQSMNNLKLTVFAKNQKARTLLEKMASVLGAKLSITDDFASFGAGPEGAKKDSYATAEQRLRESIADARLAALATLQPTSEPASAISEPPDGEDADETPQQWARRMGRNPNYRVAGLCYRINGFSAWRSASWEPGMELIGGEPFYFRVDEPPRYPCDHFVRGMVHLGIDDASTGLRGREIALVFLHSTGDLRVLARGERLADGEKTKKQLPYRFGNPPKDLQEQPFAKALRAWSVKPTDFPSEMLDRPVRSFDLPAPPGYFDGEVGVAEKLEYLYRATGIPIVSTSFRLATRQPLATHDSVAKYLADLSDSEKCFLRSEDGFLLARHPAYWLLEKTEPQEGSMLILEQKAKEGSLNLNDYATFAIQQGGRGDLGVFDVHLPMNIERWMAGRGMLCRFDPKPIGDGFPALHLIGSLSASQRNLLSSGEPIDCLGYVRPPGTVPTKPYFEYHAVTEIRTAGQRAPLHGATWYGRVFPPDVLEGTPAHLATEFGAYNADVPARYSWFSGDDGAWTLTLGYPDLGPTFIYEIPAPRPLVRSDGSGARAASKNHRMAQMPLRGWHR